MNKRIRYAWIAGYLAYNGKYDFPVMNNIRNSLGIGVPVEEQQAFIEGWAWAAS